MIGFLEVRCVVGLRVRTLRINLRDFLGYRAVEPEDKVAPSVRTIAWDSTHDDLHLQHTPDAIDHAIDTLASTDGGVVAVR